MKTTEEILLEKEKTIQELLEQNQMILRNHMITQIDLQECIELLEDTIVQCCTDESVKNGSTPRLDSMALSSYADSLRYLAKHGRVSIISEYGRRVIAKLNNQGKKSP